ncbi:hypothetical protein [Streptomyces sp. NPDC023588]|uniref:hypothetical protein n=1 Tax=Streptomyces sp. NPDC023588 TaxID=3154907 RepID=UPI0033F80B40
MIKNLMLHGLPALALCALPVLAASAAHSAPAATAAPAATGVAGPAGMRAPLPLSTGSNMRLNRIALR